MHMKSTTYRIQKMMTKIMVVLVLFATSNVLTFAISADDYKPDMMDGFKKVSYYFEGRGKSVIEELHTIDANNIVLDVIIKPRSIKKQSTIAEKYDGANGYRLGQDGQNIVFEVKVNGISHQFIATNVLERGEKVLVSTHYKDGHIGITINGKKPVNRFYQIDDVNISEFDSNKFNPNVSNKLSLLKGEMFTELSAFRKALRKTLGRKPFKKHGDEIIKIAYQEDELASINVGGDLLMSSSPLLIGKNFAGKVKQVRLWKPAKLISIKNNIEFAQKEIEVNNLKLLARDEHKLVSLLDGEKKELYTESHKYVEGSPLEFVSERKELSRFEFAKEEARGLWSNQDCIDSVSEDGNSFISDDYWLTSGQSVVLTYGKKYNSVVSFFGNISEHESVPENNNCKFYFLRKDERAVYSTLFVLNKGWELNGVNYVNKHLADNAKFGLPSNSVSTNEDQETELENNLKNSANNFTAEKLFKKFVYELNWKAVPNNFYALQELKLVSQRNQKSNLIVKNNDLKYRKSLKYLTNSDVCSFAFDYPEGFNVSVKDVNASGIPSSDRIKYVNQNLGEQIDFVSVYPEGIKCKNKKSYNSNFWTARAFKLLAGSLNVKVNKELSYHNIGRQKSLGEKNRRSKHRLSNSILAKDNYLLWLNKERLDDQRISVNSCGILTTNKRRVVHDIYSSEVELEQLTKSLSSHARHLINTYEGPPDIKDSYKVNFSRSYLNEVDIQYALG